MSSASRLLARAAAAVVPVVVSATVVLAPAHAEGSEPYLNLPLDNRFATDIGGVHPELPTDPAELGVLVDRARASGRPATDYAALLAQYRLAQATTEAGIALASWNPNTTVAANRDNLIRSYRYYEDFQLARRELQWAGMGGQVGADFGGGVADFELATDIYDLPGLQENARAIIGAVESAFGPEAVGQLPEGLRELADHGAEITTEDLRWYIRRILAMQKAIFSDLMPLHYMYVHEGLGAIEEFHAAGLIDDAVLQAWYDIASGEPDRVAAGNAALLRREQYTVVGAMWDEARNYRDGIGKALTYATTLAGSPSVAGVVYPRNYKPIRVSGVLPDGRAATLTTPLPSWDWSVFDDRWDYITTELLPKYRYTVEHDWPTLEALLRVPYEVQFETHRPINNIPQILGSALSSITVTID
ncbi:hypothetical protein OED52_17140 [Rhodococcus sp. Z13]|uniref:Uncharacterized protein n=1 Tax=Rhodococcus sacchari TaxID=2962047 RepID=A0ACD4DE64_9NOCA|nr:hypothetical protein [Rhodococcus sp. Z13]UYP18365.1 hypothetical protein OED52_17140 [Rhodococcus sp. Z13]